MTVSRVLVGLVALVVTAASGCTASITVKTKTRFQEPNISKTDTADWDGKQPIKISSQGVGTSINGGVFVTADPNATKVSAVARFLAMANDDDKASADQSILDAKGTYTIDSSPGGITVSCGHGQTHGSSNSGESGCERLDVTIPAGAVGKPLVLTVLSGNGELDLELANATIQNVGSNASSGNTTAKLPDTKGANVSLVSVQAGDIDVTMNPASWAADEVNAQADADKLSLPGDVKNGAGAGGRGTAGTGLASLKLTSQSFAGSTGKITIH
jgi:hypothetical protein